QDMWTLTGKDLAAFVEGHPELTRDWRSEWRRDNPEDDALLAMYGFGGKIQTPEAFEFIRKWSEELGVGLEHIPTQLPPEGSEENYFEFIKEMTERGWNSSEAQLILAEDDVLREYLGYDPIKTPLAVLRITVEWREWDDWYDAIEGITVEGVTYTQTQVRKQALIMNPEYAVARRKRDAYRVGVPDNLIDTWVEYYSLPLGKVRDNYLRSHLEYYQIVWLSILGNQPI
ncbi:hypothetical protein LCGC14_2853790, partial [marine sediment metagenome]